MIIIELKDPILESIWKTKGEPFTLKRIMEETKMPYTTIVHRILRYESQGVLVDRGTKEEPVGRPLNLYSLVVDKFEEVVGKVVQ